MLDIIYKIYLKIPNFYNLGLLGKLINKVFSVVFNIIINLIAKKEFNKNKRENFESNKNLNIRMEYVVSLTSIPTRINNLWITIESLLKQTVKPDKIVLWLVNEEMDGVTLPDSLLSLKSRGLEIYFTSINLRPHNKYFHSCKKFPNASIVTVDDDIIYPNNMLENLIMLNNKFPNAVCANLTSLITIKSNKILPYKNWKEFYKGDLTPNNNIIQLGVSGVLYPPKSLPEICFNEELIKKLSLSADDIWLNAMCYLNGTKIVTNMKFKKYFVTVNSSQKITLHAVNTSQGRNDKILKDVHEYFDINLLSKSLINL